MYKFLVILLSITSFALTSFASFNDTKDHLFETEINRAFESKIINGYIDGSFKPDKPVSRAEALKILLGGQIPEAYSSNKVYFNDYSQSDWYYKYLNYAKENSIVDGYNDGSFRPGGFISIAESLKILFQTRKQNVDYLEGEAWFESLNNKAKQLNLYEKSPANFLDVNSFITRSELVYLIDKISQKNQTTQDLNYNWKFENQDFSITTLKSDKFYKLENQGILVMFEDGFLSFEIKNNTFANLEDSLVDFKPLEKSKVTSSKFFQQNSLAYFDNDKYYEQALDTEKNLIYVISIEKANNIQELLKNFNFDTSKLNTFVKFEDLKQNLLNLVLKEGSSKEILDGISNKKILSTDVIGLGMGPIDYIYLIDLNLTVKNERNSSTILQVKDGENLDF